MIAAIGLGVAWLATAPVRRWLHWGRMMQRVDTVEPVAGVPERVGPFAGTRLPADGWDRPAVVLLHGVHPEGANEPRMARLATLFAEEGFQVHVPHVPALAAFDPDPAVIADLRRYLDAIERRHGCFGVVGISVGGGLALRALEDRPVTAVLSVGGHADLGAVRDHHRTTGGTPYARRVMAAVGEVPDPVLAALSPRRPPRGPVFVLHGEGDPLIPPSQAAALCERMGCGAVVTPWLGHTELHGASPVPVLRALDQVFASMKAPCATLRQYSGRRR
ncbi:MAG: hypothetical protein CMN30_30025 [Sandaracinus sp.]|nr:hypothetical protein [Sandaracinus sp.]MAR55930.1 hypothetical protein [Rickettsiales bacterium]